MVESSFLDLERAKRREISTSPPSQRPHKPFDGVGVISDSRFSTQLLGFVSAALIVENLPKFSAVIALCSALDSIIAFDLLIVCAQTALVALQTLTRNW